MDSGAATNNSWALVFEEFGGPGEIRTHDLFHAMEARSQLRHRPVRATVFEYSTKGDVRAFGEAWNVASPCGY